MVGWGDQAPFQTCGLNVDRDILAGLFYVKYNGNKYLKVRVLEKEDMKEMNYG